VNTRVAGFSTSDTRVAASSTCEDPVCGLLGVWTGYVELAEVGHVEETGGCPGGQALVTDLQSPVL
jgi:hypothetical protein